MPELLAPAGDLRCLKTAYMFGADAAYIGGPALQLRAAKTGFTHEKVAEAVSLAHGMGKKLYVAANSFNAVANNAFSSVYPIKAAPFLNGYFTT